MSGTGTSFEQQYNTTHSGILPLPLPSNIEGNPSIYENGEGSMSVNIAPNLSLGGKGKNKNVKRKSVKRKSLKRKSLKRKSVKRKSVKRKSTKRIKKNNIKRSIRNKII